MYGLVSCDGCDGCGSVTNDKRRIPWTWHTRELRGEDGQEIFDPTPVTSCNKCKGCGRIPRDKLTRVRIRKKYG